MYSYDIEFSRTGPLENRAFRCEVKMKKEADTACEKISPITDRRWRSFTSKYDLKLSFIAKPLQAQV